MRSCTIQQFPLFKLFPRFARIRGQCQAYRLSSQEPYLLHSTRLHEWRRVLCGRYDGVSVANLPARRYIAHEAIPSKLICLRHRIDKNVDMATDYRSSGVLCPETAEALNVH